MPAERAADHRELDLGSTRLTSLVALGRGTHESAEDGAGSVPPWVR